MIKNERNTSRDNWIHCCCSYPAKPSIDVNWSLNDECIIMPLTEIPNLFYYETLYLRNINSKLWYDSLRKKITHESRSGRDQMNHSVQFLSVTEEPHISPEANHHFLTKFICNKMSGITLSTYSSTLSFHKTM